MTKQIRVSYDFSEAERKGEYIPASLNGIKLFENGKEIKINENKLKEYFKKEWDLTQEDEKLKEDAFVFHILYTFIKDTKKMLEFMKEDNIKEIIVTRKDLNIEFDTLTVENLEEVIEAQK